MTHLFFTAKPLVLDYLCIIANYYYHQFKGRCPHILLIFWGVEKWRRCTRKCWDDALEHRENKRCTWVLSLHLPLCDQHCAFRHRDTRVRRMCVRDSMCWRWKKNREFQEEAKKNASLSEKLRDFQSKALGVTTSAITSLKTTKKMLPLKKKTLCGHGPYTLDILVPVSRFVTFLYHTSTSYLSVLDRLSKKTRATGQYEKSRNQEKQALVAAQHL